MARLSDPTRKLATLELLWILAGRAQGMLTRELRPTSLFHVQYTLASTQVASLLRATKLVIEERIKIGSYELTRWRLAEMPADRGPAPTLSPRVRREREKAEREAARKMRGPDRRRQHAGWRHHGRRRDLRRRRLESH